MNGQLSAHDALCAYEEELERLRIEYRVMSNTMNVRHKARAVIDAYYIDTRTRERQFELWLKRCNE